MDKKLKQTFYQEEYPNDQENIWKVLNIISHQDHANQKPPEGTIT